MRVQSIFEEEMRMATICNYEIHGKGRKKAALFLFAAMASYDDKVITHEEGTDEEYVVWMKGDCKWSLDSGTEEKPGITIDLDSLTEDDLRNERQVPDYWDLPLRQKSRLLKLEILAHSWSSESEFESFEHYQNGQLIDSRTETVRLPHAFEEFPDESPNWILSEYPTYEAFCADVQDILDLDLREVPESEWDQREEGVRFLNAEKWSDVKWACQKNLYPSFDLDFTF